jgi:hypothetical protein
MEYRDERNNARNAGYRMVTNMSRINLRFTGPNADSCDTLTRKAATVRVLSDASLKAFHLALFWTKVGSRQ